MSVAPTEEPRTGRGIRRGVDDELDVGLVGRTQLMMLEDETPDRRMLEYALAGLEPPHVVAIPLLTEFRKRLVCDTDTCLNSLEDADGDRIGDWVEFVICGTRTCADGPEDYDGNGVSDASELAACVVRVDDLAITGGLIAWVLILLAVLLIGGGGALWWWRRRRTGTVAEDKAEAGAELSGADV